jgi:peptide/nickel transport system substrate-binding protein
VPEEGARMLSLRTGEADMVLLPTPSDLPALEADPDFIVEGAPGVGIFYLAFNLEREAVADVRVRQAIAHAIDRELIVEAILEGGGVLAKSVIGEPVFGFKDMELLERYPYDPERARELLAEAGFADGFSLRLHTNSNNAVRMQIAEILQFEAAQVGIEIEFTGEEFGAFIDRILGEDRDFDLFILGWAGNVDPDYATYGLFRTEASNNYIGYSNPAVDELLDRGRTLEPGSPASIANYQQVQNLLMADVPFAFFNNSEEIGLVQDWIEGWGVHPYSSATYMDLHKVTKSR